MRAPRILLAATLAALALTLPGCAARTGGHQAEVTVRVAPRADPAAVEVQLAAPRSGYRAVHSMRAGETRRFAVPAGWVTVRVPGLCVVPTTASRSATVEIGRADCSVV